MKNLLDDSYSVLRLEVSSQCNFRCTYCFTGKNVSGTEFTELPYEEAVGIIDDALSMGIRRVVLVGGEPLLHPRIVDIVQYVTESHAFAGLVTNGSLLTNGQGEKIVQRLTNAGLAYLGISLDGLEGKDAMRLGANNDRIRAAVVRASKHLRTVVFTVINESNYKLIPAIYEFAKEAGAEWKINTMMNAPDAPAQAAEAEIRDYDALFTQYRLLLERYFSEGKPIGLDVGGLYHSYERTPLDVYEYQSSSHPCEYRMGTINVTAKGDLTICPLKTKSLAKVRDHDHLRDACGQARKHEDFYAIRCYDLSDCHGCRYQKVCGGGCRAHAELQASELAPDPQRCLMMVRWEKFILPILPEDIAKTKYDLLDESGHDPYFSGVSIPEAVRTANIEKNNLMKGTSGVEPEFSERV